MELIFLIIQLVVAAALIGIVLIQRSSSDGFGLGSGSGSNFLSGRQSANFMTRATAILATVFILNSLWLGILAANRSGVSLVDEVEAVQPTLQLNPELKDEPQSDAPPAVPVADEVEPAVTPVVPAAEEAAPDVVPEAEEADEEPAAEPVTPKAEETPPPAVPVTE